VHLYHFPADLQQLIDDTAANAGEDAAADAKSVLALSDAFVGRAPWIADYATRPELRRAYLRYYVPVNLPKLHVPLAAWRSSLPRGPLPETLRCLDVGAGPGTALLGFLDFLRRLPVEEHPKRLELVALDQSYEALKDAERLLRGFAARTSLPELRFEPLRTDLAADRTELFPLAVASGRFDLVLAANVLCEVVRESGLERAEALLATIAEQTVGRAGTIVVVEPGLRQTARDLHRLRDRLLAAGRLHVLAPCLHEAPCPALATDRDWCIADMPWVPPPAVREIDRRSGLDKRSLKFAYLVLGAARTAEAPGEWRVVSDVLELKGESRVYLCADGRWIVVGRLKRDGLEPFAGIARGDRVEVRGLEPKGSMFRLPPGGSLRRIPEAEPSR
jgi:SAM-dependent methyltransferase